MGCGSSSLKGEAPTGISSDPAPKPSTTPLAQGGTRGTFATVDYDGPSDRKKSRWSAAPHETEMPHELREQRPSADAAVPETEEENKEKGEEKEKEKEGNGEMEPVGGALKPYHTLDEEHMAEELERGTNERKKTQTQTQGE